MTVVWLGHTLILNMMGKQVSITVPLYPKPVCAYFFPGTLFLVFTFSAFQQLVFSESHALLTTHGNFFRWAASVSWYMGILPISLVSEADAG